MNVCAFFHVLLTSPDDRTLFMYSRKDSSLISLSVKMKLMPLPCWPAVLYKPFRSSIRLAVLYELEKNSMHINMLFILFFSAVSAFITQSNLKSRKDVKRKTTCEVCACVYLCVTAEINLNVIDVV